MSLSMLLASTEPVPEASRPRTPPAQPTWIVEAAMAIGVGLLAYALSFVLRTPVLEPNNFGAFWQQMSVDPFGFVGSFPHRMFGPLLAWLLGMGGPFWVPFTQLTSLVFLAMVFRTARWRGAQTIDATLITFAIALTGAVQTYKAGMVGYVDNLGYTITLCIWMAAPRAWLFWPLVFLNLTNHEMVGFFLPWFLWLRRQAGGRLLTDIVGLVTVLGLYIGFRLYVDAHAKGWAYDAAYFQKHAFVPFTFLYLWFLAAVHQLHMYGALLVVLVWHLLRLRPNFERTHALLIIGGFLAIFCVAYDVSRHSNMIFVPILIASVRFLGTRSSRLVYAALIAASACVVHYTSGLMDWIWHVMTIDLPGSLLILPEHRYDLPLIWEVARGTVLRAWPILFALAWEALFVLALAQWLLRREIGGSGVTTAGQIPEPAADGAIAAFRRATSALRRRPGERRLGS